MTNAGISYVPDEKINPNIVLFRVADLLTAFTPEQKEKEKEILEGKPQREDLGWGEFTSKKIQIYTLHCNHLNMMKMQHSNTIAEYLKEYLH